MGYSHGILHPLCCNHPIITHTFRAFTNPHSTLYRKAHTNTKQCTPTNRAVAIRLFRPSLFGCLRGLSYISDIITILPFSRAPHTNQCLCLAKYSTDIQHLSHYLTRPSYFISRHCFLQHSKLSFSTLSVKWTTIMARML